MELTQSVDWLKQPHTGYVVNTSFSDANSDVLSKLMNDIENEFGNAIFCMPKDSLHITLFDWIAPLIEYDGQDKTILFDQIKDGYDQAITEVLDTIEPFSVRLNEVHVSPTTIYIKGEDNGQFQKIRQGFLDKVTLLSDTKQPPTIIHSSLGRFTEPIQMDRVREFLAKRTLDIIQPVETFRLVKTSREPMLEYEVLKTYSLN